MEGNRTNRGKDSRKLEELNEEKTPVLQSSAAAKEEKEDEVERRSKNKRGIRIKPNKIFKYISYMIICVLLYIYRDVDRYYHFAMKNKAIFNSFVDFKISVITMVVIFIYRYGSYYLLKDYIVEILDIKYQGEERKKHSRRMVKWICDIIYYSVTSILGFAILFNAEKMPTWFGGNTECYDVCMRNYPYIDEVPYLKYYYLVQLGNHYYAVVDQFLFKRHEKNHHEMMLHHILTCGLMMLSYQMNLTLVGALILLAHDPGDVFLCVSRFYVDIKNKKFFWMATLYLSNIAVWIVLRIISYPICLVRSVFVGYISLEPEIFSIVKLTLGLQVVMLSLLYCMHVYWVGVMLNRLVLGLTKNKIVTT